MTNQEDKKNLLVFHIQQLQTEIDEYTTRINELKTILERKELQLKEMTNQQPLDIIEIGGVKYQRVEEPKPKTLLEIIREWNYDEDYLTDEELVNRIERQWLPDEVIEDGEDYNKGWNACLKYLQERIK
jgi:hypothetical protein